MRNKKVYLACIVVLVALGVGLVAVVVGREQEPSYQSKRLSIWLEDCDIDKTQLGVSAAGAVRQIGADCMPTLLRMLERRDGVIRRTVMGNSLEFRTLGLRITSARCVQVRAAAGCRVLGPKAEGAIPELVKLLPEPVAGRSAREALAAIGPKAMVALIGQLTNTLASYRGAAANALLLFGTNAVPAIPVLAAAAQDPDAKVRRRALMALGTIGSDGQAAVVDALTRSLRDEDALVRRCGVGFLASLGARAKGAAPAVSNLVHDTDPELRRLVPIVLKKMEEPDHAHTEPPSGSVGSSRP